MDTYYPMGFVVYSELYYDETGIPLDKTSEGGFAWILKDTEFDPEILFPKKNQIRTLNDLSLIKNYIFECINKGIEITIHFIYTKTPSDLIDKQTELEITALSDFLGYDYVSPDLDFSAIYEVINTDIYDKNTDFVNFVKSKANNNGYFENSKDLDEFITKRQEIINRSCEEIAIEEIKIILKTNLSNKNSNEFFPVQIWKVNLEKFLNYLKNIG